MNQPGNDEIQIVHSDTSGRTAICNMYVKVQEQSNKCSFDEYNLEKAVRDAILLQMSDARLRKKVFAEDLSLENMVKIGLSHEQTQSKLDKMAGAGAKAEDASVRSWFRKR